MTDDLRHAGAGALAVGAALGVSELVAGLFESVPSLVGAIGDWVIDNVPAPVKDWAIAVFGTADKAVLVVGIVTVALGIGALAGWRTRDNIAPAAAVFLAFGALALAAAVAGGVGAVPAAVAAALAVATSVAVLAWLRGRLPATRTEAEGFDPTRRAFLRGVGAVIVVSALSAGAGRLLFERNRAMVARRQSVMLPPAVEPVAAPPPEASFPVADLSPIVTPNSQFYRIDTALSVPSVDTDSWTLAVHGLVDQPVELTYGDLLGLDLVERFVTLSCVSNQVGGGLVGTARWLGVPLRQLLDRAGVRPEASQIVGRAVDGFTVGFPTEAALDGRTALVAVGMNGEPLPLDHGFPARLVVAGLYGYVSATKWLSEIELTTWEDFDAYWVPRGWSKEGPVKTQSRIDVPRAGGVVEPGEISIAGVAWAPNVGIERVEVQIDDGEWAEAQLAEPLNDDTWRQWMLRWTPTEGDHEIRVRATDRSGYTQTPDRAPPAPDGATGWHTIRVTASG